MSCPSSPQPRVCRILQDPDRSLQSSCRAERGKLIRWGLVSSPTLHRVWHEIDRSLNTPPSAKCHYSTWIHRYNGATIVYMLGGAFSVGFILHLIEAGTWGEWTTSPRPHGSVVAEARGPCAIPNPSASQAEEEAPTSILHPAPAPPWDLPQEAPQ